MYSEWECTEKNEKVHDTVQFVQKRIGYRNGTEIMGWSGPQSVLTAFNGKKYECIF